MTEEMRIEGMHCVSCERRITRTLAKEGITVRAIDHATGALDVDLGARTRADLARTIAPIGYRVAEARRRIPARSVETRILRDSALALTATILVQSALIATAYAWSPRWGPQYATPLLLLPIAIATNLTALWHQRAYRRDVSCMIGMMVGMTIGMTSGFTIGAVAGLLNGMFTGAVIGLAAGMIAGAYAGSCCGMMGTMEGLMAGFMGGTMGAMLTVMLVADHPVAFLAITIAVMIGILAGLSRIIAGEHEGSAANIKPWPLWKVTAASIGSTVLLSAIMMLLPRGLY